ncbi:chloride channel protein [Hymenobacter cavernae]|uniref:CBS domain-containing protein n=1 Tax=Hymenobacter cavernae TaxID=2044852 RepID=A0ABQ1UFB5_9BACT|nr:chloride channel protein [Hymenobacter cavernae]GGF16612.1 hypothetical protein GCM10011383_30060 [Hymenobacter cavernae]
MKDDTILNQGIPLSTSLDLNAEGGRRLRTLLAPDRKRVAFISALAVLIGTFISIIAKDLVYLINLVTNLAFYQTISVKYHSPAQNNLGLWVIVVPAIGGLIVGLMALYWSKAIRGHGIPEAIEQVLTNQSRIKPSITFLKPLSAAISIGTGGPFGTEGPIIATGGAFGSTIGQIFKITHNERKILLAAGATAGMTAVFGCPIAAIFLAIELLLFEFSPRSIIPVALACITGAAGHHLLFENGPEFKMADFAAPDNFALAAYSVIGIAIGGISVLVTKIVFWVEDLFEELPIHWMWWPAMGGLVVGVIGYFAPRTLGVGYENIGDMLAGRLPLMLILSLCLLKFTSWVIALGSGTSGGTLGPLLTIGAASGALLGGVVLQLFPGSNINLPLAALVGMSAMFAGASRALLTSIVFALETTMQSQALLPLLGACTGSYLVSFFLMGNTIMTEKIARRGVSTPDSFEPDVLEKVTVGQVLREGGETISGDNSVAEVREWLEAGHGTPGTYFIIVSNEGQFEGIVSFTQLFDLHTTTDLPVRALISQKPATITDSSTLRRAVEIMSREKVDVLPVLASKKKGTVVGVLSYRDILSAYQLQQADYNSPQANISLKRRSIRILLRGQHLLRVSKVGKVKEKNVSES